MVMALWIQVCSINVQSLYIHEEQTHDRQKISCALYVLKLCTIDTYHSKGSGIAACMAAGACIDLLKNIVTGKCKNGFALCKLSYCMIYILYWSYNRLKS